MIHPSLTRAFGECMKTGFMLSFLALWIVVPVMAQTPDVVATPNPDDFLAETYSVPAEPFSVQPQMVSPDVVVPVPSNKDILTEIFGEGAITLNANQPVKSSSVQTRNFSPTPGMYYPKQAILTKLPELPPPQMTVERFVDTVRTPVIQQSDFADQLLEAVEQDKTPYFSIPKEIRIKFYPGQSDLSLHAMKWIRSFAIKVRNDPRLVIEMRASEENWPLQSKRLGLMLQTILEAGASRHQIVIYKSPRSADTILLGYGRMADQEVKMNKKRQKTISW